MLTGKVPILFSLFRIVIKQLTASQQYASWIDKGNAA